MDFAQPPHRGSCEGLCPRGERRNHPGAGCAPSLCCHLYQRARPNRPSVLLAWRACHGTGGARFPCGVLQMKGETMTEEELNEIEARANAATEGPWWRTPAIAITSKARDVIRGIVGLHW